MLAAGLSIARPEENFEILARQAISLWQESFRVLAEIEYRNEVREAVKNLLFDTDQQTVDLKAFLQLLLPRVALGERESLMNEAVRRIPGTFANHFNNGASGWPDRHHSRILEQDPGSTGDGVLKHFQTSISKGITLDLACLYAPFILSWHEFVSSARTRGSMSRTGTKISAALNGEISPPEQL